VGPKCPKCGTIYEWTCGELQEVAYCPKTYFCQNESCREIYVLTAEEITNLQEQLRPQLQRYDEMDRHEDEDSYAKKDSVEDSDKQLNFPKAIQEALESVSKREVARCSCGTPIYTIADGLIVFQTGIRYEFEYCKVIWFVVPTQQVSCTHCLFQNYYENKIQRKPYVVCASCKKATQDYMGWEGTDVEGGYALGGYGSTQFDEALYYFPGIEDGWHCYGCLDNLILLGKGQKKYDNNV
jgi:hypothetical protein